MCALRQRTASYSSANLAANNEANAIANGLTSSRRRPSSSVMLQHNTASAPQKAHLAHAAVLGLHAICCGLPALAMLAAASGLISGVTLLSGFVGEIHSLVHRQEVWILAVSAALVVLGGWLELSASRSRRHGFPWLFAFSALCLVANAAIILAHRAT